MQDELFATGDALRVNVPDVPGSRNLADHTSVGRAAAKALENGRLREFEPMVFEHGHSVAAALAVRSINKAHGSVIGKRNGVVPREIGVINADTARAQPGTVSARNEAEMVSPLVRPAPTVGARHCVSPASSCSSETASG